MNLRIEWVDACKGFAIILVVLLHVTLGLHDAKLIEGNEALYYLWVYITATATPIFFILSGFFVEQSIDKAGYKVFLKTCLHYVLYPYVLWSLIQWVSKLIFSSYVNTSADLDLRFLIFDPLGQFWFLHSLFIAQLLYMIIHKYYNKYYFLLFFFFMLASYLLYWSETTSEFLRALSFILLGAQARRQKLQNKISDIRYVLPSIIALTISGPLYKDLIIPLGFQDSSNFLGGIAATLLLSATFIKFGSPETLRILGKHSMYIFVLHLLCLVPFRIALIKLGLINPFLMVFILLSAGLFMPLILAIILE